MKIAGLQKTTLIDYPGEIACTLFLHGCNFRCGFCYNSELVIEKEKGSFPEDEILYYLKERVGKLSGVCITGGEPLISLKDDFLKKIKEMGYKIKIDTNGSYPKKLQEFIDKGYVDYVAMDIKGSKDDYDKITSSMVELSDIEESIKIISKLKSYEFRTTIIEKFHDITKIKEMAEWIKSITNTKPLAYYLQGFKNQGNFIDKNYQDENNTTERYLISLKEVLDPYFKKIEIRC